MNVLEDLKQELLGKKICRISYWRDKCLQIGLGEKSLRKARSKGVSFYGQWEIVTYNASWRIIRDGKILIASQSEDLVEKEIVSLPVFELEKIIELTKYDVSFIFSNNFEVDFFNCFTEDDELIDVLKDDRTWWEKDQNGIWNKGKDPEKKVNLS